MAQETGRTTHENLARAGLVLSYLMFAFGAVVSFFSGASTLIVFALGVCSVLLLSAAIFAGQKAALFPGRFFPLGSGSKMQSSFAFKRDAFKRAL